MKERDLLRAIAVVASAALLLALLSAVLSPLAEETAQREREELLPRLLPGSSEFTPEAFDTAQEWITAAWRGETGWVLETTVPGYVGEIVLLVGVGTDGRVTGVVVRDMSETFGLGLNALWDVPFLTQFLGTRGTSAIGENIDAMTGATVTSKAIAKGVNAASAYVTGADLGSSATQWEG